MQELRRKLAFYKMAQVHSELQAASSLHPKIITTINIDEEKEEDCHLDVVYVLPASVFVDPYQLQDLEAKLGKATVFGEHDLELPLEKVKEPRGSIVFLRQKQPSQSFNLELPIHLRYQQPLLERDHQPITIEAPYAGWTCGDYRWPPISSQYPLITPYQDIESSFTRLTHDPAPLTLSVPIGKVQDAQIVTYGTFGTVVLCTLWIARSVSVSIKRRRRSEAKGKRRKSE
ncbi:PIG-X [Pilaira anomala]|nr:PIG-X [Pilaira anomala]